MLASVDDVVSVPLPFALRLFGTTYAAGTPASVVSNGHLYLEGEPQVATGGTIPSSDPPDAVLAPFWADLVTHEWGVRCHDRHDSRRAQAGGRVV